MFLVVSLATAISCLLAFPHDILPNNLAALRVKSSLVASFLVLVDVDCLQDATVFLSMLSLTLTMFSLTNERFLLAHFLVDMFHFL